ncbi:MAG: hypothetical protein LBC75_11340 [Fibromonadaceae bacterium]|jgi:hypothetical protein|nr:hypothetical protein [Fibromonadaceae bacterium]
MVTKNNKTADTDKEGTIPDLKNQPPTRREILTLFELLSNTKMYIPKKSYYQKMGINKSRFNKLKKEGEFDKGFLSGSGKKLIHRYYDMKSKKPLLPGLDYVEPIEPKKPRKRRCKKAQKLTGTNENANAIKEETTEIPNIGEGAIQPPNAVNLRIIIFSKKSFA